MPLLKQQKGENDRRKYFTINFHKRLLPGLIVLGFNDTSTLVGHFVSSPREREKEIEEIVEEEIVEEMKARDRKKEEQE